MVGAGEWVKGLLACGSETFTATLLFDLSMSALPGIATHNCSPTNRERELGLDCRETNQFYPILRQ